MHDGFDVILLGAPQGHNMFFFVLASPGKKLFGVRRMDSLKPVLRIFGPKMLPTLRLTLPVASLHQINVDRPAWI